MSLALTMGMIRAAVKRVVLRALNAYDKRDGAPVAAVAVALGPRGGRSRQSSSGTAAISTTWRGSSERRSTLSASRSSSETTGSFARHSRPATRASTSGFSYKTNPLPGAIRALHRFGASAEVISHFELWLALQLGVPPGRIILNGPAKTLPALDLAVRHGVKLINIDGFAEIEQIDRRAGQHGRKQPVGVRIVTSVGWASQFGFRLAGRCRDGGVPEESSRAAHLDPCALHIHLGTGIRDTQIYFQAIREALQLAARLRAELGVAIRHLDLGGGFGVPTVRPLSPLDAKFLANGFRGQPAPAR